MTANGNILIVDDSEENVLFISQILEDHGYDFSVARNGKEALASMREHRPRLVLLDIMMPRKSGINVFSEMKRDEALGGIPVIFVSGASEVTGVNLRTGDKRPSMGYEDDLGQGMGASLHEKLKGLDHDGFIEKPIDPPVLLGKLEELLGR
jgi:CheY-like chemotaxis protein